MKKRLEEINPAVKICTKNIFLKNESILKIFELDDYDYVLDAIDTLSPKCELISIALKNDVKVVSSMGAGAKLDPLQIKISDISKTIACTLAKKVRKKLKTEYQISKGVNAVFSTEKVNKSAVQLIEGLDNKLTTVGTVSYLPMMFGLMCSSVIIRDLLLETSTA